MTSHCGYGPAASPRCSFWSPWIHVQRGPGHGDSAARTVELLQAWGHQAAASIALTVGHGDDFLISELQSFTG